MEKPQYIYKTGKEIKTAIADAGVPQWAVAHCANIGESTFYRWLRNLTDKRKAVLYGAIEQAKDFIKSIESGS